MGLRMPDLIKSIGVMCVSRIALLLRLGTRPKYSCLQSLQKLRRMLAITLSIEMRLAG